MIEYDKTHILRTTYDGQSFCKPKFAVFACGPVGEMVVNMFVGAADQVAFVMVDKSDFWNWNDRIIHAVNCLGKVSVVYYDNDDALLDLCSGLDALILAYWGYIIRPQLLSELKYGAINLHTSYLPYGKGKHAHYWAIRENTPFGVTVMKIDEGLDTGQIIFQREIRVDWEDTARTLYFKGLNCMRELLHENRDAILRLNLSPYDQQGEGTIHYVRDMQSEINLNGVYTGRELLDMIRAKDFAPISRAFFRDNDVEYEVAITICRKKTDCPTTFDYKRIYDDNI